MLWIPFRNDEATTAPDVPDSSEEDGGSKALPGGPLDPHPRVAAPSHPRPRSRAAAAARLPSAPPRVRTSMRAAAAARLSLTWTQRLRLRCWRAAFALARRLRIAASEWRVRAAFEQLAVGRRRRRRARRA